MKNEVILICELPNVHISLFFKLTY